MNDPTLLRRATTVLEGYGLTVEPREPTGPARVLGADAWLRVARARQRIDYVVEIQHRLTRALIGAVLAQTRERAREAGKPVLLVTEHLTPPLAETLKDQRQHFVDTAGNAYLECPEWLVWVNGRKAVARPPRTQTGRAFTRTGLKLLFALLRDPTLANQPYREIAATAGVALGAIPPVMDDLQAQGHLLVVGEGRGKHRRLAARRRLLDDWALAYARTLRPRTLLRTLTTTDFDDWTRWDLAADDALWGSEPAANLLVGRLRPGVLTLYARKIPARLVVAHRLIEPNPGATTGLVEIRQRFWSGDATPATRNRTVAPVLVYADLLATGDARCLETAERIHEHYLARLFEAP